MFAQARIAQRRLPTHAGIGSLVAYEDSAVEYFSVGLMTSQCEECLSMNFVGELVQGTRDRHFNICCQNGKVTSLNEREPVEVPEVLESLLLGRRPSDREFRERIRMYNNALAFVSFGAKVAVPKGNGPPVYRIHGAVYHASGALAPPAGTAPSYAQLYVWDEAEALEHRMAQNPGIDRATMEALTNMIRSQNPYAEAFRFMSEIMQERRDQGGDADEVHMRFSNPSDFERHRYNKPSVREVAVVFLGEDLVFFLTIIPREIRQLVSGL